MLLLDSCYKHVWHIPLLSVQWINSWWWTDELSETCRVSWQNKFVKLVYLVGFITKKVVTMHGHMNVKKIVMQGVSVKFIYTLYFYLNQGIINYTVHEDLCTFLHNSPHTYWNKKRWEQKFYGWMKHTVCVRYTFSCT